MSTVDEEARSDAWKVLLITTIVLTIFLNFAFLYKIIKAAGSVAAVLCGPRGPRSQTLVSLLVGDIVVALFSLVVETILVFEGTTSVKCRHEILAEIYLHYTMPAVYGVGLVILAVERAMVRERIQTGSPLKTPNVLVSLAVSALPWILAITITLPLTLADVDLTICPLNLTFKRARAVVWVCQVCPVVIAVFTITLTVCCRPRKSSASVGQEQVPAAGYMAYLGQPTKADTTPAALEEPTPSPYEGNQADFAEPHPDMFVLSTTMVSGLSGLSGLPSFYPNQQNLVQNLAFGQQFPNGEYSTQGYPQNEIRKQPLCTYPDQKHLSQNGETSNQVQFTESGTITQNRQNPNQVQYLSPGTIIYTPSGQPSPFPPPPALRSFYSLRERAALGLAALVFCVCVIPMAIYQLIYVLNEDRETLQTLSRVTISDMVFWLMAVRSFVSPLVWVVSGSFDLPDSTV